MKSSTSDQILVGLVVLLVLGGTAAGTAAAQGPSISVSVEGTAVSDGDRVDVKNNPMTEISVTADSTIEVVEVRVNGNIQESYQVGQQSFSESLRLALESGENEVEIIVNAGEVSTFTMTVAKDNTRPRIAYTSPFQTGRYDPAPDSVTVSNAQVTLSGDLYDVTSVQNIRVERRYTYQFAGTSETDRSEHRIQNPGDSFSQDLFLGNGENTLIVTYTDRMDNTRQNEITVTVDDRTDPQLDLNLPERSGARTIQVQGMVSDNVKVNTVIIEKPDGTETAAVQQTSAEPNPDRLSMEINQQVSLNRGDNQITITATDMAGNTVEQEYNVVYDPNAAPRVTIDQDRTTVEDGSVTVRGRVDSGRITGVSIEAIDTASGETVDLARVHSSEQPTNRVDIEQELSLADGPTEIRVLVTDAEGEQHETSYFVDPESGSITTDESAVETESDGESDGGSATSTEATADGGQSQDGGDGSDNGGQDGGGAGGSGVDVDVPGFTPVTALIAFVLVALRIFVRE